MKDYVNIVLRVIYYAAHIEKRCLVSIGAVILDRVQIGKGSIIGASSIVTESALVLSPVMGISA